MKRSSRLFRLRQRLGMSQRELAREFDVTPGAINHWEQGTRSIPGPVWKLIELYESYLDEDQKFEQDDPVFRKLSATWSGRLMTSFRTVAKVSSRDLQKNLEGAFHSFLKGHLSKDRIKRKIQIALLSRGIESVDQMKGLPLKAAQMLTYLSPELAPELRSVLSELQYLRRPMAPTLAARVIFEDLGKSPAALFSEWSPKPFAAASIGQVHRARLKTGEWVAVKVQYPDVKKSIEADFRGINFIQNLASLFKASDREILSHIRQTVMDECDYGKELENLEAFRQLFAEYPEIVIPRCYPELSNGRVLTMEFIEGKILKEFLASSTQTERDRAGEIIWKFTMLSQLKHGLMNADAHAGNFIFMKDKVGFLDFGRVYQLDPRTTRAYQRLCLSYSVGDRDGARAAIQDLPFVLDPAKFDFDAFWNTMLVQQRHGQSGKAFRFSFDYIAEGMRATQRLSKDGLKVSNDMLWCTCSSHGLWTIFALLGAEARWGDLAVELIGRPDGQPRFD